MDGGGADISGQMDLFIHYFIIYCGLKHTAMIFIHGFADDSAYCLHANQFLLYPRENLIGPLTKYRLPNPKHHHAASMQMCIHVEFLISRMQEHVIQLLHWN